MRVTLEIRSGPSAGRKVSLETGRSARIGRNSLADIVCSDNYMSGVHFLVECDEKGCVLRDLGSRNGTLVNGQSVKAANLKDGDTVVAGNTTFFVRTADQKVEESPAPVVPAPEKMTPQERLLSHLRGEFQPLYALLDAANEPSVLKVLFESKEEYKTLFEGAAGAQLTHFAPYLVRLPKESPLLETLVQKGWGKNWGVYLTSPQQLPDLRGHFRQFLMVKMPDGKQVYFRFYDPRVLRVFLPTCTPEETTQFFGPIQNYLVEDENPKKLFRFVNTGKGSKKMMIALADQDERGPEAAPADAGPGTAT